MTYSDYWSNSIRYPVIADNMSRNRYKSLRQVLHFVDNLTFTEECGTSVLIKKYFLEHFCLNVDKVFTHFSYHAAIT